MNCFGNKISCIPPSGLQEDTKNKRQLNADMHKLAQNGKYKQLLKIISNTQLKERKSAINRKDENQNTALHLAAANHHYDVCLLLIENHADINSKGFDDKTPTHLAVQYSSDIGVKYEKNRNCKSQKVLKLLLNTGADVNSKDINEMTPLHYACRNGDVSCVELLLQSNSVDIEAKTNQGKTSLHLACYGGHTDAVSYLLDKGAKINCEDENEETPIMLAATMGRLEVVEILFSQCNEMEKNEMFSKVNKDGISLIYMTIINGQKNVLEFFIQHSQEWDFSDVVKTEHEYENTLLHAAAEKGDLGLLRLLIEKGADINYQNKFNQTPIFLAVLNNHAKVVEFLVENERINVEATDMQEKSILHICAEKGRNEVLKVILQHRKRNFKKPANENEKHSLTFAKAAGVIRTGKRLAKKKTMFVNSMDVDGNSPLHLAALHGKDSCTQLLLQFGANVHARNAKKETPLMCARNKKICKILLQAGAVLDAEDSTESTALHHACKSGNKEIVEILLKKGANVSHLSNDGKNALDCAIDPGKESCALVIINHKDWEKALRNKIVGEQGFIETPIRKLIKKMPNLALEVFHKCTTVNEKYKSFEEYKVFFNHEFLDDEFSIDNWNTFGSQNDFEKNPLSSKDYSKTDKVLFEKVIVKKEADPNSRVDLMNSTNLRRNHPLYLIMKSKHSDLLTHPLTINLINHLWQSYGKPLYYSNLLVYIIFMVTLNIYGLTLPPPFSINSSSISPPYHCVQVRLEAQVTWGSGCITYQSWRGVVSVVVLLFSALGLLTEALEIASYRAAYVRNITNFIELGAYTTSIVFVINTTEFARVTGIREAWQWQIGSISIILSWTSLILFLENIPTIGVYIEIVFQNTKSFFLFFLVLGCFILGFGSSFFLLFQNKIAFSTWGGSCVKTFSMMLGEYDYENIFNGQNGTYVDAVIYPFISFLVYIAFMIILGIIIVNLLARLSLRMKYAIPRRLRKRVTSSIREFCPNQYRDRNLFIQWLYSEENISQESIDEILNVQTHSEDIEKKLNKMQDEIGKIHNLLSEQSNYLKSFIENKLANASSTPSNDFKVLDGSS